MTVELSPSEKVYNYIMEKIVSKEWQPKTKIMSENQLSTELNVSRISVREALEKLVAFGILDKKRGSGTIVNEIKPSIFLKNLFPLMALSENDLEEIMEFRIFFEYGNVHMFMENYDEKAVVKLKEYYEKMVENYDDQEQYHLYDFYFHKLIAEGTKNPIARSINETLHSILKFNIKQMYHEVGPDNAIHYHKAILEAIEKRDTALASLLMRRHLEEALENIRKLKVTE
ncbi:FadR/GntR family transcriptional regulator [Bacillus sp. REN16]|uniref:FadR/GntR family transcriptional regulator n=1 Tax=Bacillus sp. REN16 TaxID=2887296 RepID=UPI001E63893F|nr:FadR/GntR family transcriptional regulator [Bacillus sp. REN16]MCC3358979.1 FadR family transcriptional regulator [Bacillus sp. REN16]